MKFFSAKTTWTNWEFIPLKLCIASIYVIVGAYFHDFFMAYWIPFIILFAITTIWAVYLWAVKMKAEN